MSLYKGRKKIAGNIANEKLAGDIGNYSIIFDDNANLDNIQTFDTILNQLVTETPISTLITLIKTGLRYINNQLNLSCNTLQNKLNTHSYSAEHDNRYYTKIEIDSKIDLINSNKLDANAVTPLGEVSPVYSNHGINLIWADDGYLYVKVDSSYVAMIKGWTRIR